MKSKLFLVLFWTLSLVVSAQISMPKVFSNHMVLQRDVQIPLWGNAPAGAQITATLGNKQAKTCANENGKWMLHLPVFKAGGPYKLAVWQTDKPQHRIEFSDVLIGDVWLASGQSNMEWQVQQSKDAPLEIQQANYPNIRFFFVAHNKSVKPGEDVLGGEWRVCDSATVKTASAVGYFFARKINRDINVPIGILQSTWGGTPVEAWTSKEMLRTSPITKAKVQANDSVLPSHFAKDSLDLIRFWDIVYHPQRNTDKTITQESFDDTNWHELTMPTTLKTSGMPFYEGMVWLRKAIELPSDFRTQTVTLNLGHPEMNYSVYVNGNEVCKTVWNANATHSYSIPKQFIHTGVNLITVRMAYLWGGGGFNPPAQDIYITDGNSRISLAGNWKYCKNLEPTLPKIYNYQYYPTFLYNAMLKPLIPCALKGFLWYQGEANDSLAYHYRTLFPMMITDWRTRWQQGDLPFLYVQLPNYKKRQTQPMESEWAELREAQSMTLSQPHTAMVCAIDLGEADNIHPKNKQAVGQRLALLAEKNVYGKTGISDYPLFRSYIITGNSIRIRFDKDAQLTTTDKQAPREFCIAGADKVFYRATAQLQNNELLISSDNVPNPVAVRYAWSDNPDCNLTNIAGLPVVPFRTDQWKGITEK